MPTAQRRLNISPRRANGAPTEDIYLDEKQRDKVEQLLRRAKHWWDERADFRRRRARSRDYRRGNQWQEETKNKDGEIVTEEEAIKEQGRIPWVINQMATITRNLKGQWRQNRSDRAAFAVEREDAQATEMINVKRRGTRRYNRAEVVEADQFEEHVMSGASGFKVTIDWDASLSRNEVSIDPIDQTRLFFNLDLEDRRMNNLRIIGELHDMRPEELLGEYARDGRGDFDPEKAKKVRDAYANMDRDDLLNVQGAGFDTTDSLDFYSPADPGLARVIEVWTKERKITQYAHDRARGTWTELDDSTGPEAIQKANERRNAQGAPPIELRRKIEPVWVTRHLTPRGDLLFEAESPYWHDEHPYVIAIANLIDGETWGLLEQIIDPQRWLNRLVAQIDHAMGVGAKGVLMVPEETIPDDLTIDDFAEEWSKQGGVLKIKMKPGVEAPQEIVTNSIKPGSFELLQQLKQWIEQTSGVTGAQTGEQPQSGTPAMLFQQQIAQSSLTNLDYFESFFEGVRDLDNKTIQCIQQAIDQPLRLNEGATRQAIEYKPEDVRSLKFDVSMGSVKDTATFQQIFEEDLRGFLERGYIDFGTYLQMSAHPKAETLLRVLQQRDPEILGMGSAEMQGALAELAGEELPTSGDGAAQGQPQVQPSRQSR